ncbi:MAG: Lrp/AsnC family transcriptional regulator [Rhodospirillaceae bacterium]|nr:Lrp/AsnC family transcriptional regulator [Rhodospirillaceae bacterium]MDD9916053.1 Lrp/AsnC family transcriptional regulator [Rhodospirillaceae bacterium]
MHEKLDQIDHRILDILSENADLPNKVLADKAGLSQSACLRRVKNLKRIGAIQRIVAVVDPDCIERRLTAVVTVKFERHGPQHRKSFFEQLRKEKAISQCYMVAGEIGSVLILNVVDMDEYTQIADRLFHADENVAAFTTYMVMEELK